MSCGTVVVATTTTTATTKTATTKTATTATIIRHSRKVTNCAHIFAGLVAGAFVVFCGYAKSQTSANEQRGLPALQREGDQGYQGGGHVATLPFGERF